MGERGGKNLYEFVGNNPISMIDRLGLSWLSGLCSCPDKCPFGALKILQSEYKIEPYGTTPQQQDVDDATANAIENISTITDLPGYLDDPIGTIADNTTFNLGGVEGAVNGMMNGQSAMEGVWLFIRFQYQKCEKVTCFPLFWTTHNDWRDHPLTSWTRGTIGQTPGLDAFTDSNDVDNNLEANTQAAIKQAFGDQ
jgi:hypothetical protein